TNAYEFEDPAGAFKSGDAPLTGRKIRSKTLQLCFWSPGDELLPSEEEVHFGFPTFPTKTEKELLELYGLEKPVDYRWIFQ
ncbi:MAG: hypothetical protein KDA41_22895, partial [Planctomycetales bacterium]|nr:hypothetical protein [Planctomycetales bacterium]